MLNSFAESNPESKHFNSIGPETHPGARFMKTKVAGGSKSGTIPLKLKSCHSCLILQNRSDVIIQSNIVSKCTVCMVRVRSVHGKCMVHGTYTVTVHGTSTVHGKCTVHGRTFFVTNV